MNDTPSTPAVAAALPLPESPIEGIDTFDHPVVHLAVVRRTDYPMAELPALMDGTFSHLPQALAERGVEIAGPALSQHFRMPTDTCDLEAGLPVRTPLVEPFALDNGFLVEPGLLPATPVAATSYVGPYEGLGEAWGGFMQAVGERGLQAALPFWEIYVTAPMPGADPSVLRTDLVVALDAHR